MSPRTKGAVQNSFELHEVAKVCPLKKLLRSLRSLTSLEAAEIPPVRFNPRGLAGGR